MFKALEQKGIKCVRAQYRVSVPHLGLKTELDGLGIDKSGAVVVIELKTTQHGIDRHNLLYKKECQKKQMLSNGLPNTEYVAHQLQTGFEVYAMYRLLPPGTRVVGVVVVCANDGARIYDVNPMFTREHLFVGAPTAIKAVSGTFSAGPGRSVSFMGMPTIEGARADILRAVARLGYTAIDTHKANRYGSFVAHDTAKTSYLVVALVYVQTEVAKMGHRKYAQLLLDARALWISLKRKKTVRSCVFYYHNGSGSPSDPVFRTEFIGATHIEAAAKPSKNPKKTKTKHPKSKHTAAPRRRTTTTAAAAKKTPKTRRKPK